MAKLYFVYASMGGGKSANLLQARFNYIERGQKCLLLTAAVDDRYGKGKISSRIGISADADIFSAEDDLLEKFIKPAAVDGVDVIMIDEIQFATPAQIWQLARGVDICDIPIMSFGLRTDFQGNPFPGSTTLLAIADELRELKGVCHCGSAARMVLRKDADGRPTLKGEQIQIGGNDTYTPLCRKHWLDAHGML